MLLFSYWNFKELYLPHPLLMSKYAQVIIALQLGTILIIAFIEVSRQVV